MGIHVIPYKNTPTNNPGGHFWLAGFHRGKLKVASELSLITCWMVADTRLMQLPPGLPTGPRGEWWERNAFCWQLGPQEKRGMKPSYSNWEGMKFDAKIIILKEFPL